MKPGIGDGNEPIRMGGNEIEKKHSPSSLIRKPPRYNIVTYESAFLDFDDRRYLTLTFTPTCRFC